MNWISYIWPFHWWVGFGTFAGTKPISDQFGADRGLPVDRYYIDKFLTDRSDDIHGRVLEFGDDSYTRKFGGDKVTKSEVWVRENEGMMLGGDLGNSPGAPIEIYDCIICTQMLGMVYEVSAAVVTLHQMLKTNGTLLLTVGGISRIGRYDWDHYRSYWRFTSGAVARLLEKHFLITKVTTHGNVYAAVAFLEGLAVEELSKKKLDETDFYYQVLITARAVRGD